MSKISAFVEALENKVQLLEAQVQQSMVNHHGILGMLQNAKEVLAEANKVIEVVAPESGVAEVIDAVESVDAAIIDHA